MKVILAQKAGFCFGVKRAMDIVCEQIEKKGMDHPIYTYGSIIHNEEVVKELEKKGVKVLNEDEASQIKEGTVIIRSHGLGRKTCKDLKKQGCEVVDATCPFVKKIHQIVEKESRNGRQIIIIGNEKHPEVEGIKGWCITSPIIIETIKEAENLSLSPNTKICIVSQTTFNYNKFKDLVEIILKRGYDRLVMSTICNATEERQAEAKKIAADVDAMIVIGSKNSSNTQKLFEICKKECEHTYYIQTLIDLDLEVIKSMGLVGITAGASTPNNIIEEVLVNVRKKF